MLPIVIYLALSLGLGISSAVRPLLGQTVAREVLLAVVGITFLAAWDLKRRERN